MANMRRMYLKNYKTFLFVTQVINQRIFLRCLVFVNQFFDSYTQTHLTVIITNFFAFKFPKII